MMYDIKNLLDYLPSPYKKNPNPSEQIICDIDKTYLETKTTSLFDLAKTAIEKPKDKVTILGANDYLEALQWGDSQPVKDHKKTRKFPRNLHFVSASPPQLRKILEEKFSIDKLYWTSTTFKNQLYNIKKIKFHLLREQIAYKTLAIFNLINKYPSTNYYLIGDNSESDTYIYTGIKLLKDGILSHKGYIEYLKIAGLTRNSIKTIVQTKGFLKHSQIKSIFIRNINKKSNSRLDKYIVRFSSYKNLFLASYKLGYVNDQIFCLFLKKIYRYNEIQKRYFVKNLYFDLMESDFRKKEAKNLINHLVFKQERIQGKHDKNSASPKESTVLSEASTWIKQHSSKTTP